MVGFNTTCLEHLDHQLFFCSDFPSIVFGNMNIRYASNNVSCKFFSANNKAKEIFLKFTFCVRSQAKWI